MSTSSSRFRGLGNWLDRAVVPFDSPPLSCSNSPFTPIFSSATVFDAFNTFSWRYNLSVRAGYDDKYRTRSYRFVKTTKTHFRLLHVNLHSVMQQAAAHQPTDR